MTMILGLTGSIATGKSTVSDYFKKQGIPVIDADVGSRVVVEPGTRGLEKIVTCFGKDILKSDGTLNRKALGEIVFSDNVRLKELNAILEKHIREWIKKQMEECLKKNSSLIVLDIPLLFESDYLAEVDLVMVVATTKEIQIERLMKRDKLTEKEAEMRVKAQISISNKVKRADVVIDNNGTIKETHQQVSCWLKQNALI